WAFRYVLTRNEAPRRSPRRPDAREARARDPARARMALRAQMGRIPRNRLPGRRRDAAVEPLQPTTRPGLPRARGRARHGAPGPLRGRRRDRSRPRRPAGIRPAPAPAAPSAVPRRETGRRDPDVLRRVRSPGGGRRQSARPAPDRAPDTARARASRKREASEG